MISQQTIDEAVRLLVAAAHPTKVILFGSYARAEATENSDLDFLVIVPSVASKQREMTRLRPLGVSADVLVASTTEVEEWGHLPSTTLYWALTEGKVLHEAADLGFSEKLKAEALRRPAHADQKRTSQSFFRVCS